MYLYFIDVIKCFAESKYCMEHIVSKINSKMINLILFINIKWQTNCVHCYM